VYDPLHPTPDEIREWAYDVDALEPCQDWDLVLSWVQHEPVFLELASDDSCPSRRYFLSLIYLMVGDAVRTSFRNRPRPLIEAFIARGDQYDHPDIKRWQVRSRELLKRPELFNYERWCAGGLARDGLE
jgi:hypothetical protein